MHELSVDERGDWARALQLARQGHSPEEVADILMPQIIARKTAAVERQRAILDDILDERLELSQRERVLTEELAELKQRALELAP